MKRVLIPALAYLLCAVPLFFCAKAPRNMQILTSAVHFRTMTSGHTYIPENASEPVSVTDSIVYQCPATGSDPITLASLQNVLSFEIFQYPRPLTPSLFPKLVKSWHALYVEEYERDMAGLNAMQEEEHYLNYARLTTTEVVYNTPRAILMQMRTDNYTGGAHGIYTVRHLSIVLDGAHTRILTPEDLFVQPTDSAAILNLVKGALMEAYHCATEQQLAEQGFDLDALYLTPYVSAEPGGVCFIYQPYEIAPYALGAPAPVVPYDKIRPLLQPGIEELFSEKPAAQ